MGEEVEKCQAPTADAHDPYEKEISSEFQSKPKKEPRMFNKEIEEQGCREIVEALTEEELQAMPDENMPLRHFRADKGNVKKSIERIKYALKWREEFGVEKILRAASDPKTAEEKEIHSVLLHE